MVNKKVDVIPALLDDLKRIIPEEDVPDEDFDVRVRAKGMIESGSSEKKRMSF